MKEMKSKTIDVVKKASKETWLSKFTITEVGEIILTILFLGASFIPWLHVSCDGNKADVFIPLLEMGGYGAIVFLLLCLVNIITLALHYRISWLSLCIISIMVMMLYLSTYYSENIMEYMGINYGVSVQYSIMFFCPNMKAKEIGFYLLFFPLILASISLIVGWCKSLVYVFIRKDTNWKNHFIQFGIGMGLCFLALAVLSLTYKDDPHSILVLLFFAGSTIIMGAIHLLEGITILVLSLFKNNKSQKVFTDISDKKDEAALLVNDEENEENCQQETEQIEETVQEQNNSIEYEDSEKTGNTKKWILIGSGIAILLFAFSWFFYQDLETKNQIKSEQAIEQTESEEVFMYGCIDRYTIEMSLSINGENVHGSYFYASQGPDKKLTLTGTIKKGDMALEETDEFGQVTGHFKGDYSDGVYDGVFTTQQGKRMSFAVSKIVIE